MRHEIFLKNRTAVYITGIMLCLLVVFTAAGCGKADTASQNPPADGSGDNVQSDLTGQDPLGDQEEDISAQALSKTGLADSLDDAVIVKVDEENGRMLFYSRNAEKTYFLSYDSATTIRDTYDRELVAGELKPGDIVKTAFLKDKHMARGIWLEPDMVRNDNVGSYDLHINASTMETGGRQYAIVKNCPVISRGKL